MSKFGAPEMKIIHLSEDIIVSVASNCPPFSCNGFYCDDCVECEGAYDCGVFECATYHG